MAICSVMVRLIALVIAATALAACASHVVDYIPTWAGGPPKDMPPRPGTPEYEAYRQKMDDEVTRDKSNLGQKPIPESLVCPNKCYTTSRRVARHPPRPDGTIATRQQDA